MTKETTMRRLLRILTFATASTTVPRWALAATYCCALVILISAGFDSLTTATNTTATMVVGTGASLAVEGSGTIAATTAVELAANGANCPSGEYSKGVDEHGAAEGCTTAVGSGDALVANPLSQFGATTSAQLAGVLTNESGTGVVAMTVSPAFTTPDIGSATGNVSGNAGTATALAANGANCSTGHYPLGVNASGAVEDCTAAGLGSGDALVGDPLSQFAATTSAQLAGVLSNETGAGLAVFATSPVFTTPNIGTATGSITGNAGTATALAANGTNCDAGEYPRGVDASGNAENCAALSAVGDALKSDPLSQFAATTSAQLAGVLSNESGTGVVAMTISPVFTTPNIGSATGSINGNAATATALAANGADCAAGYYPLGVDAAGAVVNCTAAVGAGDMVLANTETVTGVKTFGSAGAVGRLKIAGTTSGATILDATAAASPTITLPTATGTLIGTGDSTGVTSTMITNGTVAYTDVNSTQTIAADPANGASSVWFGTTGLIFEGDTDAYEGLLTSTGALTADRTWTLPAVSGTIVTTGDTNSITDGMVSDTLTCSIYSGTTLTVSQGGTGATTLTDGGILLGSGTGAITALGAATNGQIPIGDGTTDPVLAAITGTANEITVTNGAGTITLDIPTAVTLGTITATSIAVPAITGLSPATTAGQAVAYEQLLAPTAVVQTAASSTITTGVTTFDTGTVLRVPTGATETTDAAGELAFDSNAYATSFGALQTFNGTAGTYVVGVNTASTPAQGKVPTYNTGGSITWETPTGAGDMINANAEVITGMKTFGAASNVGKLRVAGNTSGTTTIAAAAAAGATTATLPAASGILVGDGDTGTVTSTLVLDATIGQVDVDDTATIGTNPALPIDSVWFGTTGLLFEGVAADNYEGLLTSTVADSDKTWTLPNASGTLVTGAGLTTECQSWNIMAPAATDDFNLFKSKYAITITDIDCIVTGTTSATIEVWEADATGTTPVTVDAPIVCDADGAADDGTFTNGAIDAADWVQFTVNSLSGTPTSLSMTVCYTRAVVQ